MSKSNGYARVFGLTVFIVSIAYINAQTQDPYEVLSTHWFYKCMNQTKRTNEFDKLHVDAVEFRRYLRYAFTFIPEQKQTFCNSERSNLEKRMAELTRDLKPCLSQKEKFLEDYLLESFKEMLHFFCHNNGEHINSFFSSRNVECRNKLLNSNNNNLENCFGKIFKPTGGVLQKKDYCDDLAVAKKCFAETLEVQCPTNGAYKKLNEDFFNYVRQPCAGCAFYINSLLLTVSLLVSYIFSRK